jgi:hypothetical protein
VFLGGGQSGSEYNFGELRPVSISGHVRLATSDEDCTGQTGSATPIPGVVLHLLDAQGQKLQETTTDESGSYEFKGMPPGTYAVTEFTPVGLFNGGTWVGTVNGRSVGREASTTTSASIHPPRCRALSITIATWMG